MTEEPKGKGSAGRIRAHALEMLRRPVTPELYGEIRELWKQHSIAEDARDIPGLLATLTEDCIYEIVPTGHIWRGHEGAERFYTELLTAFPDIEFHLSEIVIGPQGVWEEATSRGIQKAPWLGEFEDGKAVEFTSLIYFPWDAKRRLFGGERVYTFEGRGDLKNSPPA